MRARAIAGVVAALWLAGAAGGAQSPAALAIDYPAAGAVFPPDFHAPTFLWRDPSAAARWTVEIAGPGLGAPLRIAARGERMTVGEIDPRAIAVNIGKPKLTPQQASTRTWRPDPAAWAAIRKAGAATVTINGYGAGAAPVSRGQVAIRISPDKVGAPIFYRDVPLMPSETEKGVIKPLAASAVPLIAWRVRDVSQPASRVVMQGIHSCANCHSVSSDGKTLGMDVDGPLNDKGLYALIPIRPRTAITGENMLAWSTFEGKLGGKVRVGFMSQVSPTGEYVVTTISDQARPQSDYQRRKRPEDLLSNYYVANFPDHRFLQVFYPTRGILAWYSRATGRLEPLPGADDPRYVHTNAVWSPDGKYLVFSRAAARDPYPPGARMAEYANDPKEMQIQYDLYRIPFNGGKGGRAEPIRGASANGMSNSFPKISPDGRWIVWVQARNGQLMRPDSKLWIAPFAGGEPRLMRANTPTMNSWHSFSPNGRWLVFSSKARGPYTQMYLTHIDEQGRDTPAILIENATAANRAVNIPEFVNIAPDGLLQIDAPVTEYYRAIDVATDLAGKGSYEAAVAEWRRALTLGPPEARVRYNLANALSKLGRVDEAIEEYGRALSISPDHAEAHNNLGNALRRKGRGPEAMEQYRQAIAADPSHAGAMSNLGSALAQQGRVGEAIALLEQSLAIKPDDLDANNNLGLALAMSSRFTEAVAPLERAAKLAGGKDALVLDLLSKVYAEGGRFADALRVARQALAIATAQNRRQLMASLQAEIAQLEARSK
jgi:tetratricopeptide (TPR) repeat protein